ncbi:hypothetical protein AAFF_G00131110 [Aldrovandia affinis]|uniref:Uncharacterized protein n=1 Tax=Aldrovandia affinis TaxID=143900 RepID=A0AAD7RR59_9TELE|nr:hypothetical protein AAFF_G00131110 [Aldrovandia affinis]
MLEDDDSRESPYKRTNENVEEQYTPQSLATLQSVFEELGKLSAIKGHKRQRPDDDQFYRGDDDDIYRLNNLAYEDVAGGEEWTPVEEKVETEEVVKDSQEEFDRGSDENDEDDDAIMRTTTKTIPSSDPASQTGTGKRRTRTILPKWWITTS